MSATIAMHRRVPPSQPPPAERRRAGRRHILTLAALTAALVLACAASLAVGSNDIPLGVVRHVLLHPDGSHEAYIIGHLRVVRTLLALGVGAALAVAGALMQAVTRNPLADPGLLGVTSGASLFVVCGIAFWGLDTPAGHMLCAAAGAVAVSVLVFAIGSTGPGGATPVRLVLAGVAVSSSIGGLISAVLLTHPRAFASFRYWDVGALVTSTPALDRTLPAIALGVILALTLARPLDDLALGDDLAQALGTSLVRTRGIALVAITLLCAAATAVAGPIGFVGLMAPPLARGLGADTQGRTLRLTLLLGPLIVLVADIVGRIIARPGEIAVGLLTAAVGAPVLLVLVRRLQRGGR
ncbi:iron chelate uptake ABC transporter family permease subunit [Gephyromycinifex aptenodytis]|uniref:iron chelate uptake ABC transporter family permease subunit n=1 Tax=Gephyromycinifex aptenodytis TaxID=2716227 RepID=UPI001B2FE624|nr:iron chelate uptake ABC transporter family permease subunit [Gephyromycinifex aptenodytis]